MLKTLATHCAHEGTSCKEGHITVAIKPNPGEGIVFYWTDCERCRAALGIGAHEPASDLAAHFQNPHGRSVFLFIEMKSDDMELALRQIARTYEAVFLKCPSGATPIDGEPRGLIVMSCGVAGNDWLKYYSRFRRRYPRIAMDIVGGRRGGRVDIRQYCAN